MMNSLIFAICILLLLAIIFCIKMIPILMVTFPLENTDAVMFTLTQNIDGSRDFVMSLIMGSLKSSLVISLVLLIAVAMMLLVIRFSRERNILKFEPHLTFKRVIVVLDVICFVVLAKSIYSDIPVIDYYVKWKDSLVTPEHSDFYIREYVDPDSVHIEFKEKKNLILIFLESMEYNFQDSANGGNHPRNLIPEITGYLKNEQSFIPGGTPVAGMGWTIADVIAKTCGIPMVLSPSIRNDVKEMRVFLPGVTCLTDVLINNYYNVVVSQGSHLKFAGMDAFLNSHSAPRALGFAEYLKDKSRIRGGVISEWGVKDSMHFELVKEHIARISKQNMPWAVWLFTINTHTPHGIVDSACGIPQDISKTEQMQVVISCSSRQLDSFIKWAKIQEWFNNTVIAVMGDHAMMAAPREIGFKDSDFTHYWLDFFINSTRTSGNYQRRFTSLDMFPTILEAIGANLPEGKLGLGRSLYLNSPTLLEKYGLDSLNSVLGKRSVEYDYFLFLNKQKEKYD